MIPPFIIDGVNSAEVFLSNMDYAQVSAAVVVQELIDGCQNDYLLEVGRKYPGRFITCGMCDYFADDLKGQAESLIDKGFKGIAYATVNGRKIRMDGMTYGGFDPAAGQPAEALMQALLAQYRGEILEYEQKDEPAS